MALRCAWPSDHACLPAFLALLTVSRRTASWPGLFSSDVRFTVAATAAIREMRLIEVKAIELDPGENEAELEVKFMPDAQ